MTMIEVDPKLFIKCRLCLEDSGTYQIVPVVREQISYCFDINVEPFDGLPQLICKKCQSILCDYSKTKKYFIEKQDELKNRTTQTNNLPQEKYPKLENLEIAVKRANTDPFENGNTKRRKVSVSSLTNKSENNEDPNNELVKKESCETENIKEDWKKTYHKTFACRFCSSFWYSSKAARYHKGNHRILQSKHADIFSKFCVVQLPKIDNKPNLTGSLDQVVYSKNNIIAKGNLYYSIGYRFVEKNILDTDGSDDEMKPDQSNVQENSDSSSRSNNVVRRKVRRRICSQSSDETVVLENQSNSRDSIENVCINIEDTDSDDETPSTRKTTRKVVKKNTVKVIKESAVVKLIASTQNKYLKKKGQPEKPPIELLNRKITSIGRQIINKRGFNCNRLMKYMEHLNLNIIWLPRSPLNITSNTNYYKIIPRARYKNEKNIDDFEGYKIKYNKLKKTEAKIIITQTRSLNEGVLESTGIEETRGSESSGIEETPGLESSGIEETPGFIGASDGTELKTLLDMPAIVSSSDNHIHLPQREYSETPFVGNSNIKDEIPESSYASELEGILLHSATTSNDTKKLLNANPVANPKQLKKFTCESKKDKAKSKKSMLTIEVAPIMPTLEVNPDELTSEVTSGIENIMPVITFTRSLAVPDAEITESNHKTPNNDSTNNGNLVNSNSERSIPTAPRIKVKSVTELMSKETLSRMNEPSAAVVTQHQNGTGNIVYSQSQNPTTSQPSRNVSLPESHIDKYIILDTVEFPNTKTNLPFKYFKMLLQVHNISLLDTDASLTAEFHTLLRFKVQYNQNAITEPVVLSLSLFCANNVFCFKIKDRNDDNIDMSKLTALWQWEILKIYRGEVVSKILAYAKKISLQVYENTNRFMCLLKSIRFVSK